jgi:predicted TIM-barrel fold metal-dependent hydrolase
MARLIDAHVHVFPTPEQGRNYQRADPNPARNGDLPELLAIMDRAGIESAVMLMFIPSLDMYKQQAKRLPEQDARDLVVDRIKRYNEWGVSAVKDHPSKLRVMVGADPNLMDATALRDEIGGRIAAGASGGKFVPRALDMRPDDPRLAPAFEVCQELGAAILFQSGGRLHSEDPLGRPRYFAGPLARYPGVRLILAHLGSGFEDETVEMTKSYPNCFTDLSGWLGPNMNHPPLPPDQLVDLIRRIGADRVLFGTNYPGNDPESYARNLDDLPLSRAERDAIAFENVERVFAK